jgi:hypothetical protein
MPNTYKVLGQVAPSATTLTTAYTVATSAQAVVSTVIVANRSASAITYRIAVRPDAETIADKHYIAYDVPLAANDSVALTLGLTLGDTDVVSVYASSANTSFSLYGSEITA